MSNVRSGQSQTDRPTKEARSTKDLVLEMTAHTDRKDFKQDSTTRRTMEMMPFCHVWYI